MLGLCVPAGGESIFTSIPVPPLLPVSLQQWIPSEPYSLQQALSFQKVPIGIENNDFHHNISACLSCALLIVTGPRIVLFLFPSSCSFFAFPRSMCVLIYNMVYVYICIHTHVEIPRMRDVMFVFLSWAYFILLTWSFPVPYIFLLVTWFYSL